MGQRSEDIEARKGIHTRVDLFPLVVVSFFTADDDALQGGFRDNEALIAAGRPWIVVRDFRFLESAPTARQRRMAAEWTQRNREGLAAHCKAAISVVPHPLLRGALKAVHWLTEPPIPEHEVGELETALRLVESIGATHGLDVATKVATLRAAPTNRPLHLG